MPNLTSVGITAGVPTSGTGTVSTIDNLIASVGTLKAASTASVATDTSTVVQLNPLSPGLTTLGPSTPANSVPTVGAGFTYAHISTSTTTTVKSGAGVLHTITINTLGTVASNITVYDNTAGSGTVIAVLNSLSSGEASYTYDVAFATGLTLVTTGTAAPDVTVSYR